MADWDARSSKARNRAVFVGEAIAVEHTDWALLAQRGVTVWARWHKARWAPVVGGRYAVWGVLRSANAGARLYIQVQKAKRLDNPT